MFKREISLYLVDIFLAFAKIKRYITDFSNYEDFVCSDIHWDASIRELQIIGEATNILIKNDFLNNKYRIIVDFRNLITHSYFGIDPEMVWDIVHNDLNAFIEEMKKTLIQKKIDISEALNFAIKEQQRINNSQNVKFLYKLKDELKL